MYFGFHPDAWFIEKQAQPVAKCLHLPVSLQTHGFHPIVRGHAQSVMASSSEQDTGTTTETLLYLPLSRDHLRDGVPASLVLWFQLYPLRQVGATQASLGKQCERPEQAEEDCRCWRMEGHSPSLLLGHSCKYVQFHFEEKIMTWLPLATLAPLLSHKALSWGYGTGCQQIFLPGLSCPGRPAWVACLTLVPHRSQDKFFCGVPGLELLPCL